MSKHLRRFEIWQSDTSTSSFPAGPAGDQQRSMLEPGAKLKHVFDAYSELDWMQQSNDFKNFGPYVSPWPELAVRPYCFIEGLENLSKITPPLTPLAEVSVFADGSTKPEIPDCMPRILMQEKAVFVVDVWVRGEYGGHGEVPVNQAELITQAKQIIRAEKPELLKNVNSTFLICPMHIAEQMKWPDHGRDPAVFAGAMP